MKTLYFDCANGASGNSMVGALLDCGLPFNKLQKLLRAFLPNDKFGFSYAKFNQFNINATYFEVYVLGKDDRHRNFDEICNMIHQSELSQKVKDDAIAVFEELATALATAHQCPLNEVIFHERRAVDTMIDIVGICWGLEYFNVKKVLSSPIQLGHGVIKYRFGELTIPAPATRHLIKSMPTYQTAITGELLTPTAAAILKHFVSDFSGFPRLDIEHVGYGVPIQNLKYPGYLKILIGKTK